MLKEKAVTPGSCKSAFTAIPSHRFVLIVLQICLLPGCLWFPKKWLEPERSSTVLYRPLDQIVLLNDPVSGVLNEQLQFAVDELRSGHLKDGLRVAQDISRSTEATSESVRVNAHILAAIAFAEMHSPEEAISELGRAIDLAPNDWRPYFHRWQMHLLIGENEAALNDRNTGMRLAPAMFREEYSPFGGVL
jgi:hypothetical protein